MNNASLFLPPPPVNNSLAPTPATPPSAPSFSFSPSSPSTIQTTLLPTTFQVPPNYQYVAPPPWALTLGTALALFELLFHPLVFLVSILNSIVLLRSRLLHPNLRLILIAQSAAIALFEASRGGIAVQKLLAGNAFVSGLVIFNWGIQFSMMFTGFIGHLLLAERILATVMVRRYEKFDKLYLAAIPLIVLLLLSLLNVVLSGNQSWVVSGYSAVVYVAVTVLCLVEVLAFGFIGVYNRRKYRERRFLGHPAGRNQLTERYQLSENIRTNRQLGPTFLFHFVIMVVNSAITVVSYAQLLREAYQMSLFFAATSTLISASNMAIVITVITHHPMLRQRAGTTARRLLSRLLCCSSQSSSSSPPPILFSPTAVVCPEGALIRARTVDGALLYTGNGPEEHFQMLQQAWQ